MFMMCKMRKKMTMPCNTVFQADFESAVGFRRRCLVFVASVLLFRAFVLHFALATKLLIFMTEKSCLNDSPRQNTTFSHLALLSMLNSFCQSAKSWFSCAPDRHMIYIYIYIYMLYIIMYIRSIIVNCK